MEPADYYYGPFREDLGVFWRSLEERGSVSRVRMRLNPSRFSAQLAIHFSVVDLVARPENHLPDHLDSVPRDRHIDFLCALLYTILIDQVMYSHQRSDYPEFQSLTRYPKMDRTVGFSRTLMMANPYELLEDDVLTSRGLNREEVIRRFCAWAPFIVADLQAFFVQHHIGATTWPDVRAAMMQDQSAIWGVAGACLAKALVEQGSAL